MTRAHSAPRPRRLKSLQRLHEVPLRGLQLQLVREGGLCAFVAAVLTAGLLVAAMLAAQAPPALRVQISTGVTPDTVTVGDPFRALVRVAGAEGTRVEFPEVEDPMGWVEALEPVRVVADAEVPGAALAVYALVAWTTGELGDLFVPVLVEHPDGTAETYRVGLRLPWVQSVLPADLEGIEPRPAKDVFDRPARALLPVLLLLLALLLLALGAYLLWRRSRPRGAGEVLELTPALPPREQALAMLEQARASGLVEAGEWKPFFSLVSDAVRGYLAALSPRWSTDLTTPELVERLGAEGVDARELGALRGVLERADQVKFARYRPSAQEAQAVWREAREWVETTALARRRAEQPETREAA